MSNRVVITGIGPVTSIGIGKNTFFRNVMEHKSAIRKIPPEYDSYYTFKSRYHVPFSDPELTDYGISSYYKILLHSEDKISVIGAKLAMEDVGFELIPDNKSFRVEELKESSIILGTSGSGMETVFQTYLAHINYEEQKETEIPKKKIRFNRMAVPATMPNSIAAWISILYHLNGDCHTINASCASGTIAIGEAFRRIRDGYKKIILTGGIDCLRDKTGMI
ncbi:beta-ketoacyl-[acyl-carrier-protein] synthase family protein, partial [bacterium]|nr:beta-ketoacyl-[acyl-carrier-protein] synthase family protein [bacterium]